MRNMMTGAGSLPEMLQADLDDLLDWDNNCFLTWTRVPGEADPDASRWFTALLSSDGERFSLRLEFWIPRWMSERGVAAILPAHLSVTAAVPGERAVVEIASGRWSELKAALPRVARTCARLINELWGRTESDQVLLLTVEYQHERLPVPFSKLPAYDR